MNNQTNAQKVTQLLAEYEDEWYTKIENKESIGLAIERLLYQKDEEIEHITWQRDRERGKMGYLRDKVNEFIDYDRRLHAG